jgi:hypothetical protein
VGFGFLREARHGMADLAYLVCDGLLAWFAHVSVPYNGRAW